ncbi:ABC transporter substrate-binding protein [Rathayibacter sp. Leaf296]|uniref:ABC transporter substrate-binding protein n=1 Tax=Rathayibacter sp. Leaf296 TaxID=1736327 RepID=UPI00070292BC|nr:extracellular solute-binding protein [Rathayibacter sp. Leaf296]KQQ08258.1 hypothetical protein ASF46_13080 [Rathayibacter sp. Leaf296]
MKTFRRLAPAALAVAGLMLITGCSTGSDESADGSVTIVVNGKPTGERPEELAAFERNVAAFEKAHPTVTVEGDESQFDPSTFQALLAGGQLPTLYYVPFTEMQGLIERQQVADISDALAENDVLSSINPAIMEVVQDDSGAAFGVPTIAYSMGLLYNRGLFEQAGLDPDAPPQDWDEVREAAAAISEATDAQGFATMTAENTGGWILTTTSYGMGGTLVSEDGATATIDNDATREVLERYREMRWEDDSMGSNFLLGYGDAMNAFAAGSIGMFVQGADAYNPVVINSGMPSEDFGLAPLPQGPGGIGTLGGGTAAIIDPAATPAETQAALDWIEFVTYDRFTSEEAALSAADAAVADGLAVGAPALPLLDAEADARYLEWIADEINVPRENYTGYFETAETLPLVPEPATKAQEIYALLDSVVQAALTREDADIDSLLEEADASAQAILDAA